MFTRNRKGLLGLWLLSGCAELDSEESSRRGYHRPERYSNQAEYPICTTGVTIKSLYKFINSLIEYSNKHRSRAKLIMGYVLA